MVPVGTTGAPTTVREKTAPAEILTAKLLEVGLQLLAGAEEDPSLLGAHHEGALLVDGDAGHLRVQLGERRALRGGTGGSEPPREHPRLAPSAIFQWDFFPPIKRFPHPKQCSGLGQNFTGFMTSPKHFSDFTAPERCLAELCCAGEQELFTHHFASLFPILKVNIL